MKKKQSISTCLALLFIMVFSIFLEPYKVFATSNTSNANKEVQKPEISKVRWNYGQSGNFLVTIAREKGFFKEYGIELEIINATQNNDAMALLASNQVDVVSNSGTSNPLQLLSSGVDITIFGGHMVNGCMPIIAKKGTKWNGVKDLVGKKLAINPSYFGITGALMEAGVKEPLKASEWIPYSNYNDALAAVIKGEVDYALQGTGQNYPISQNPEVEIMCYQSDLMPNYSCCRMVCPTSFVKNNPVTVKCILKALIRAQEYYEANKDEAIKLQAKAISTTEEYIAAYAKNPHYLVHVDPLKNSVIRAWGILDKTGFLNEKAKDIKIEEHINTEIYEQAMNEVIEEHGKEDPKFYDGIKKFFSENNTK